MATRSRDHGAGHGLGRPAMAWARRSNGSRGVATEKEEWYEERKGKTELMGGKRVHHSLVHIEADASAFLGMQERWLRFPARAARVSGKQAALLHAENVRAGRRGAARLCSRWARSWA